MARVLPGTAPQVAVHRQADVRPAFAWIEAHYEAFRGQWVAVRLTDPVLVVSAPTLPHLWQLAPPDVLHDCLVHYVSTVEDEHRAQGPWWDA